MYEFHFTEIGNLFQVKFQILSYKLGLGKSLTGLGLRKFKKSWAWACPTKFSTPVHV
jgi:hypothetical protein